MGVLTIPLKDNEETVIADIMKKYNIATKAKAMRHASNIVLRLEADIAQLKLEKSRLQNEVAEYNKSSLNLLSGISGLLKLTKTKL